MLIDRRTLAFEVQVKFPMPFLSDVWGKWNAYNFPMSVCLLRWRFSDERLSITLTFSRWASVYYVFRSLSITLTSLSRNPPSWTPTGRWNCDRRSLLVALWLLFLNLSQKNAVTRLGIRLQMVPWKPECGGVRIKESTDRIHCYSVICIDNDGNRGKIKAHQWISMDTMRSPNHS